MLHLLLASALAAGSPLPDELLTVAERSGYEATSTHAEVLSLVERLRQRSPVLRALELGSTTEGRSLPLLVLADPPVGSAAEARASGKPIVFVLGNIHAGEVCGKEACLMLARELALEPDHELLEELIVVMAPIYNADGNDRMSPDNRPGQVGPLRGMGQRPNAQGLDLNRDFVKLESPEARALVRFLDEWDPHLSIDTHTTNGSHHRYTLTYDAPLNPAGPRAPRVFVRDTLLPEVGRRLLERTGYDTFFYGNFNRARTSWTTYSPLPRFGANYQGLRGQMAVLSEAYSYAGYEDRVLCTLELLREILAFAAEQPRRLIEIHDEARRAVTAAGVDPQPDDLVGLRFRAAAYTEPAVVKGYVEEVTETGRRRPTDQPMDYTVVHNGRFEATLSVRRPRGYLIPPGLDGVVEKLRQHGIRVEPFAGPADVERYTVVSIERASRPFQGHLLTSLEVVAEDGRVESVPDGTMLVTTAQPLGTLAVVLLEPQSADGLVAWSFLDEHLEEGGAYPILRMLRAGP